MLRARPLDRSEYAEALDVPAFEDLPRSRQLRIAERLTRQGDYRAALVEALPESDGYDGPLRLAVDADVSDAEIGRTARELIFAYLADVAAFRGRRPRAGDRMSRRGIRCKRRPPSVPSGNAVLLVDARAPIPRLGTGLACGGLTLHHDHGRNGLIVSANSTAAPSRS